MTRLFYMNEFFAAPGDGAVKFWWNINEKEIYGF